MNTEQKDKIVGGATTVVHSKVDPQEMLKAMVEYRVDGFSVAVDDIEHAGREARFLEQLPRLLTILRRPRLVAEVREHRGEERTRDDVVVGEQDAHGRSR